jgi:peptidoglycan hydrolase-like protein with peptidoglycan-binding domain
MIPRWFVGELGPGSVDPSVLVVQRRLGAPLSGVFDEETEARVRGVQRRHGLRESGMVNETTAEKIGEKAATGLVPEWFEGDCSQGCACKAVVFIRRALRQADLPVHFDDHLENLVRQFQSANGLKVTGVVNKKTAIALADRSG